MRAAGSLRASSGWRWELRLAGCWLAFLLFAMPASAQSENSDSPKSIEESLIDSLSASAMLRQALSEQRASRQDLETAYAALKLRLSSSSANMQQMIDELQRQLLDSTQQSADLLSEIDRLIALLIASRAESEALSTAFDDYRAEMRLQVGGLERQVKGWRAGAIVAGLVAIAAGIWAVVK
jgi:uncharacterized protein YhaN